MTVRSARRAVTQWLVLFTLWVAALAGVATAPSVPHAPNQQPSRAAYQFVTSVEGDARKRAQNDFPGDVWSQDDDFHRFELDRAWQFAAEHQQTLSAVLRSVDDRIRERWTPTGAPPAVTVPPCRPRPEY